MYKVIEILDSKTLVINYGKVNGASVGKKIRVIKSGERKEIYDGEKFLGILSIVKEELEIIRVEKEFSLCQRIIKEELNPFKMVLLRSEKVAKDLNVEKEEVSNVKFISKEPIKKGDEVEIC